MYDIPESTEELFANGERSYSITDPEQSGDNIFAMNLFLECVGVPAEMVECDDGTQVTLFDGKRRIVIDSGGLGDFHLHGYEVTVMDAERRGSSSERSIAPKNEQTKQKEKSKKMNKRQTKKRNKQIAQAAAILGALGGASRSPAKAAASRANGKKGGRPRKDSHTRKHES